MKDADTPDVRDASMIADAQAVEHYEIARYGTLIASAEQLGLTDRRVCRNRHWNRSITPIRSLLSWRRRGSIERRI